MNIKEAQQKLIDLMLLDPPADGVPGPQTKAAIEHFQSISGISPATGDLNSATTAKLAAAKRPVLNLGTDLPSRIVAFMLDNNFVVSRGTNRFNIVYVEGLASDGKKTDNPPNQWNDLRMLISIPDVTPVLTNQWLATTEPGRYYTQNPIDEKKEGAFRIAFGQYKAWHVNIHGTKPATRHEALTQVRAVDGYRDKNKDFKRTNDKRVRGLFGINQHWGYDMPLVENASAGCLVGKTVAGHKEFMRLLKTDRRYLANNRYIFYTTVIDANSIL